MLAIRVELLHGTFRGDPDGTASTGALTRGEWPPAPSRLFAALVAADGTGDRCRITDGSELKWFERLPPPVIHADAAPHHQPLRPRYVVPPQARKAKSSHPQYVGRVPAEVRPGVRIAPRKPQLAYVWDVHAPNGIFEALRRRGSRVGYLGAADSPVRLRIGTDLQDREISGEPFVPDPSGTVAICVPKPGDLQVLDTMYKSWTKHGASISRAQFGALRHQVRYRAPSLALRQDLGTVVAWLRLENAIPGRRISALTALFKRAVLSQHQATHGEPPPVLHGHGFKKAGFDLARFLALPDVGFRRSRGRIHGLALWLPPGCQPDVRSRVAEVARSIRRLTGAGVDVAVSPWVGENRPVAANPARWTGESRCWVTAFPALHERRVELDLHEVARWCKHAGLPARPLAFRSARCPLVRGAVDLAPVEANRPGRTGLPYSHVMIWFDRPVAGPVVIGAGRQRGFGLCVNADEREAIYE